MRWPVALVLTGLCAAACAVEVQQYDAARGTGDAIVRNAPSAVNDETNPPLESKPRIRIPQFADSSFDTAAAALPQLDPQPGATVTVFGPETNFEADSLEFAFRRFTAATGIEVVYTGSKDADLALDELIAADKAPDIAMIPQPGRVQDLIRRGHAVPLPRLIRQQFDAGFDPFWRTLVTLDERVYAVPASANVKSLVWYSPEVFEQRGYVAPETFDGLLALVEQIKLDGLTPWCIGIASGAATGWPVTDWIEDYILRFEGPDFYDQWVNHEVPFNDERVVAVVDRVREMWFTPGNVYRSDAIDTITIADAARDHADGKCVLHRQASFAAGTYRSNGAELGPGRDIDAFYFPTVDSRFGEVVLGAGTYATALSSDKATMSLMAYIAAPDFANDRILGGGGYLSANILQNTSLYPEPIDRSIAQILVSANPFRFDASDLMPAQIGANVFWRTATTWAGGTIDTYEFVDEVESAWPR